MLPTDPTQEFPPPSRQKVAAAVATANKYLNAGTLATLEGAYAASSYLPVGVFPGSEWLDTTHFPWQQSGGFGLQQSQAMTVPVAREIVGFSAGLVFGEEPELFASTPDGQRDLNDIVEKTDIFSVLIAAAEKAAAYGGVYLRPEPIGPDNMRELPQVTSVSPDLAVPEFRSGRLFRVCFTRVLPDNDPTVGTSITSIRQPRVWRLLEYHYVNDGRAFVEYALYESKDRKFIGDRVPLEMHEEAAALETLPAHPTKKNVVLRPLPIDRLGVLYVPNLGSKFASTGESEGRSDLAGVTDILDAIDEVASSVREEIILGAPRMMVDKDLLEEEEQAFNIDRRIFTPVNMPGNAEEMLMKQVEWALRSEDHIAYLEALKKVAIEAAGYSRQSFGYDLATREDSGPGARERKDKTFITQSRKRRHWGRKTEELFEILLRYYRGRGDTVDLTWGRPPALTEGELAQIAATDMKQGTLSIYEITRGRKPNWSKDQIIADMRRRGLDVDDDGAVIAPQGPMPMGDSLQSTDGDLES